MIYLCSVLQAHAGVAGGSISNPVDMEAFKRQQAGRATLAARRWRRFFLFSFLIPSFCFFLLSLCFSPLRFASAYSVFQHLFPALCLTPVIQKTWSFPTATRRCANIIAMCQLLFLLSVVLFCIIFLGGRRFEGIVCFASQIRLRGPGWNWVGMG